MLTNKLTKLLIAILSITSSYSYAANCGPEAKDNTLLKSIKWYKASTEQRALYHQAFSQGSNYINQWLRQNNPKAHSWGVILDIDETTLDNSWYFKECTSVAKDENIFSKFVAIPSKSTATPGVVDFTCSIQKSGGYVTLVSNRDGSYSDPTGSVLSSTIKNLKAEGVCFDQVVLANRNQAKNPSDKNPRFEAIKTGRYDSTQMVISNKLPAHKIVAYFGDNIQDFPKFKQTNTIDMPKNSKVYGVFGNGYFVLPNPMYGSWDIDEHK